jgi:hypothetical protein
MGEQHERQNKWEEKPNFLLTRHDFKGMERENRKEEKCQPL